MATRMSKCQFCGKSDVPFAQRFELMDVVEQESSKGEIKRLYFHKGECYEKYIKKEEFTKKEREEQDELNEVVKNIHGIPKKASLPPSYWWMIQDIRNGTDRYKKKFKKHYKKGVPYHIIKEAYVLAKDSIAWAKLNKKFRTTYDELVYCLFIVHGKIADAYKESQRTKQAKKMAVATEQRQLEQMSDDREVEWVKKTDYMDMSDILGD